MKSDSPFFGNRVAIATLLGKMIHNCESLFAIYSYFSTLFIKFVYRGEIFSKKRYNFVSKG